MKQRSAKGILVDFDLMKVKQQIASTPPSIDVKNRQDFVENRLRRRVKQQPIAPTISEPNISSVDSTEPADFIEEQTSKKTNEVKPTTEKKSTKKYTPKKTTQRARKTND